MQTLYIFKMHCARQCDASLTVNTKKKRWLRKSMFDDGQRGRRKNRREKQRRRQGGLIVTSCVPINTKDAFCSV